MGRSGGEQLSCSCSLHSPFADSLPSPGSSCSGLGWTSDSTLSQDEILEEIQRECAELELHSPAPHPRPARRARLAHTTWERKKELNRVAATKYREKKRAEREQLAREQVRLGERNRQLRARQTELRTEIDYLRRLLEDMRARSDT